MIHDIYDIPYHPTSLKDYRFLITGGAGFIGSNLVEYLIKYQAGHVKVLDNLSNGYYENISPFVGLQNFEFVQGDIRDLDTCKKAVKDVHFISHQAALGSVPRSIADPLTTNEVNILGFLNMLVAAKDEPNLKRMVYAASSSTYGDSKLLPKVEEVTGKPLSPYAVTKLVNELYGDVFGKVYGFNTIGLRYFNVFGPRQNPDNPYAAVIPLFIKAAIEKRPPRIYGNGDTSRDFTFVENVIQANIKALFNESEHQHSVFNVACGKRITLNALWQIIKDEYGAAEISPEYHEERKGDIKDSLADISKAMRCFGYNPRYQIADGIGVLKQLNSAISK